MYHVSRAIGFVVVITAGRRFGSEVYFGDDS